MILGEVFVTLLVITDPAGTVPVFIALARRTDRRERHRLAWQAAPAARSHHAVRAADP
jgi:multiple antibiotic resistance protein